MTIDKKEAKPRGRIFVADVVTVVGKRRELVYVPAVLSSTFYGRAYASTCNAWTMNARYNGISAISGPASSRSCFQRFRTTTKVSAMFFCALRVARPTSTEKPIGPVAVRTYREKKHDPPGTRRIYPAIVVLQIKGGFNF